MTNKSTPQPTFEILPWDTSHLKCKCGHKWDDHKNQGRGCLKCECNA